MIPAKPLGAISNIKYRLGKYYLRIGLSPLHPKVRVRRNFSNLPSLPRDPCVINEWRLISFDNNYVHINKLQLSKFFY